MAHHFIMGGSVSEVNSGSFNLRERIQEIFSYVGNTTRKIGNIFGPGVVVSNTKMEQKPVFKKPGGRGVKSNRPTYAGAWPRRMLLRCVTAAASLAKRGPHTAASYDAHSMSELLDGYASCSLDDRSIVQTINLDVSGRSPNFLLATISFVYTVMISMFIYFPSPTFFT